MFLFRRLSNSMPKVVALAVQAYLESPTLLCKKNTLNHPKANVKTSPTWHILSLACVLEKAICLGQVGQNRSNKELFFGWRLSLLRYSFYFSSKAKVGCSEGYSKTGV